MYAHDRPSGCNAMDAVGAVCWPMAYPLVVSERFRGFFKWFRGFLKMVSWADTARRHFSFVLVRAGSLRTSSPKELEPSVQFFRAERSVKGLIRHPSGCARTLMTLRAKYGVWLTRKRNCFSEMGTSSTSVIATAVALRGSLSINAISPKILSTVRSAMVLLPT